MQLKYFFMVALGISILVSWSNWGFWPFRELDLGGQIQADKHYKVVFWDFERPLPTGESYRRELEREIQLFNQQYPNITIEPCLFSWSQGQELAAAIQHRQALPDVISLGPLDISDLDCDLLAPATYLVPEELDDYFPLARGALAAGTKIAAWPRFLAPQLYLANADLLTAAGISGPALQDSGVGWNDLINLGERLASLPDWPYPVAGLDYQGLLMAVAPRRVGESSSGNRWPSNAGRVAAARIQELQTSAFLPLDLEPASYSGLDSFFSGKSALLAPAEPWLLGLLQARQERIERGWLKTDGDGLFQVLLVPPELAPGRGLPVRLEKLIVVKDGSTAAEVEAAIEWARHLGRSGVLAAKLNLLPVHKSGAESWASAWELGDEMILLELCNHDSCLTPYPGTQLEGMASSSRIK